MEWIIIGIVALFLFSKSGNVSAQTAQPLSQATGASLSAALGSTGAPPNYFVSGNPQYNAGPANTSPPALPVESQITAPPTQNASAPISQRVPLTVTQVSNLRRAGEANPSAPPVIQPVAIRTRVVGPETSSAFWTKTPIPVNRPARPSTL